MLQEILMFLKKPITYLKNALSSFNKSINATSGGSIYVRHHRVLYDHGKGCHPQQSGNCNMIIARNSGLISLFLAWIDYGLQWIPLKYPAKHCARNISKGGRVIIDIMRMWNFYLFFSLYVHSSKKEDIEENPFILMSILCLLAAFISNPFIRKKIRATLFHPLNPNDPNAREVPTILWDGIVGFARGFANGRALVATIQSLQAIPVENNNTLEPNQVARYTIGILYGITSLLIGVIYSPQAKLKDILPNYLRSGQFIFIINSVFDFLFSPITFGLLVYKELENSSPILQITFGTGFCLLAPAAMIHAYYNKKQPPALAAGGGGGAGGGGDDDDNDDHRKGRKKIKSPDNGSKNKSQEPAITVASAQARSDKDSDRDKDTDKDPLIPSKAPQTLRLYTAHNRYAKWEVAVRVDSLHAAKQLTHSQPSLRHCSLTAIGG